MLNSNVMPGDGGFAQIRMRLESMNALLEERRKALASSLESMREEVLDEMDRAQRISEVHFATALESEIIEASAQLTHAVAVLDAGGYGLCEDCGARIGEARLSFRPESTRCLTCQGRQTQGVRVDRGEIGPGRGVYQGRAAAVASDFLTSGITFVP